MFLPYIGLKFVLMIKMVVTDLDGTLVGSNGDFSDRNLGLLYMLAELGVVRVIATGRSPYSVSTILPDDFPIDYLVFSSGAGVMRWVDKSIIYARELSAEQVQDVIDILASFKVDFMVHEPIPQNHHFYYRDTGRLNPDFDRRITVYKDFCQPLILGIPYPDPATQIIAVLPHDPGWFNSLKAKLPGVKVIRTTSPMDGKSIWMEIFPDGVSKAHGVEWLCNELGSITPVEVVGIGNDYNDLDLLNYTPNSFIVGNAPDDLKDKYRVVPTNDDSGFAVAVELIIEQSFKKS